MAGYNLLYIISFVVLFGIHSLEGCKNPTPSPYYNETECTSLTWFVYSANEPYHNGCITRDIVLLAPGFIDVTDTTTKNGIITHVSKWMARKEPNFPIYHTHDGPSPHILVDTDCRTYAVLFNPESGAVQVFITHFTDQNHGYLTSLEGVKKCRVKLYKCDDDEISQ